MANYLLIFVLTTMLIVSIYAQCPPSSQMLSCSPKCIADSECSPGQKCCPNICNAKSCSQPSIKDKNSGYKAGTSGGTGNYCGNSKCNSFEKCGSDPSTKKPKCVRA